MDRNRFIIVDRHNTLSVTFDRQSIISRGNPASSTNFTSHVTTTREQVSAEQFVDSGIAEAYYTLTGDGEKPLISLEGEKRKEAIDEIESDTTRLIFLQVDITLDDGSDATVLMLVDDIELGYVEGWEFWEGDRTEGLI